MIGIGDPFTGKTDRMTYAVTYTPGAGEKTVLCTDFDKALVEYYNLVDIGEIPIITGMVSGFRMGMFGEFRLGDMTHKTYSSAIYKLSHSVGDVDVETTEYAITYGDAYQHPKHRHVYQDRGWNFDYPGEDR